MWLKTHLWRTTWPSSIRLIQWNKQNKWLWFAVSTDPSSPRYTAEEVFQRRLILQFYAEIRRGSELLLRLYPKWQYKHGWWGIFQRKKNHKWGDSLPTLKIDWSLLHILPTTVIQRSRLIPDILVACPRMAGVIRTLSSRSGNCHFATCSRNRTWRSKERDLLGI